MKAGPCRSEPASHRIETFPDPLHVLNSSLYGGLGMLDSFIPSIDGFTAIMVTPSFLPLI